MSQYDFDVFLSYASAECGIARKFVQWLRRCGLRVWIDEEQLIPGSRFRVGLQQGLQECRHMVALLSEEYNSRHWTQRELDLFDLDADHTQRRMLGIELGTSVSGILDQVFLVHQRIKWNSERFDPEAFWLLFCGLTNARPGGRENWKRNGAQLIESNQSNPIFTGNSNKQQFQNVVEHFSENVNIEQLVEQILNEDDWEDAFFQLQGVTKKLPFNRISNELIAYPWAVGFSEFAAVIALAALPQKHTSYSSWPFLDLSCSEIVTWCLMPKLFSSFASEIWFSWAISTQSWEALPNAAERAPGRMADHFTSLAIPASTKAASFREVEEEYNYGYMITPWNHFHLCWLATRLRDNHAGRAHFSKLCSTTKQGEVRTGRFLNRISTWDLFSEYRADNNLHSELCDARDALGMLKLDALPNIKRRLLDVWRVAKTKSG